MIFIAQHQSVIILAKTSSEAKICIDIEKNQYSVYYNNDYTIYSAEYIKNIENTFSEKINTIYRDYTKETYTDEHKNKLHYFFHYLYSKMKL